MTHFDPHKSYLIVGGLGGMGLELVSWMVARGARKIVISSRSGIKTNFQRLCLERIEDSVGDEVTILIDRNDLTTYNGSSDCIKRLAELATPGGIFNLAVVLRDGPFDKQSSETFGTVCGPKVKITRNLDEITREKCPQLDHFVCFSSIATHGLLGQTSYAFANSTMERICEARRLDGLPGLAVQWGPVGDVGIAVRTFGDKKDAIAGYRSQSIHSCLETLDIFLGLPYPICYSAIESQEKLVVTSDIFTKITRIMGLKNLETIDYGKTLRELGLDSLQVVEIQLFLTNEAKLSINQTAIGQLTLNDVKKLSTVKTDNEKEQAARLQLKRKVLIPLNDKPEREPIFFFPPAVSDFEGLMPLADRLDCQVIGVNSAEILLSTPTLEETSEIVFQAIITRMLRNIFS